MVSDSIGLALRETRERRSLSVEDVSRQLGISVHHLRAMENDDFSVFSAEVYARGAYMKYAEFLGLDTKRSSRAMWNAVLVSRRTVPLVLHTPDTFLQRLQNPRVVLVSVLVLIACTVGGYIAWHVRSFWRLPVLEIVEPKYGVIDDDSLVVSGVSESDVRIRINDEPILLHEGSTFRAELDVHDGINVVRIEAENAAGRVRIVERHILKPRGDDLRLQ